VYVAWTWATIWHRDPTATARLALWDDPGRATADGLLVVASVASVLAVALAITAGHAGGPEERDLRAAALRQALLSYLLGRSSWRPPSTWSPGCCDSAPGASGQRRIAASHQGRRPLAVKTPAGRDATLGPAQGELP
jgi:hypothetical protein